MFISVDTDNNQIIDTDAEMIAMYTEVMGHHPRYALNPLEVEETMAAIRLRADLDGDGIVTYEEFRQCMLLKGGKLFGRWGLAGVHLKHSDRYTANFLPSFIPDQYEYTVTVPWYTANLTFDHAAIDNRTVVSKHTRSSLGDHSSHTAFQELGRNPDPDTRT